MEGLSTVFLKDILIESKDGEWGKEHFDPDYIKMFVIRGTDFSSVRYGNIDKVPCRYIRKNIAIRKKLQCDDILIETAGGTKDQPTGRSLFLKKHILDREIDFTCASFSRFLRIDPQRAFPEFIFWYLQYLYTYGYMYPYHVQHTGVARFQYTQFASQMIFQLPSYVEQQGIAHILGTLDDKIELNRRQNATLEAMAQAIFKDWFVDFGPVHAKMEGRPPEGMSREIADLFPDRLDGEGNPEGWERKKLGGLITFYSERIKSDKLTESNYVSTENMLSDKKGITKASSLPTTDSVPAFCTGHILVSNIRPYFKKIWFATFDGGRSNDVLDFCPLIVGTNYFIFNILICDAFFDFMMQTAKGSKMPRGDKNAIMAYSVVAPTEVLQRAYSSLENVRHTPCYTSFFQRIQAKAR